MSYQHGTYVSYVIGPFDSTSREVVFPVDSRDTDAALNSPDRPDNARAFYFYDLIHETEIKPEGGLVTYCGGRHNISDRYYINAYEMQARDIDLLPDDQRFWIIARTATNTYSCATVIRCYDDKIVILLDAKAQFVFTDDFAASSESMTV